MDKKLVAAAALAGSLSMASFIWGAQATPAPTATHAFTNGTATLVAEQGGGGGGSGHMSGGGPRGGGPSMGGGPRGDGGAMAERGGGREFSREGPRGHVDHGDRGRFVQRDRDHRHFAERDHDHDHDFDHRGRHRVFRNGVWVWIYGPDYYASDDCWWLHRRALATGSPYWWSRYNYCVGYY